MNNPDFYNGGNYGYDPEWYVPSPEPPKKSFSEKKREFFADERSKTLLIISTLTGLAVILYFVLSNIYSFILAGNPELYAFYKNNYTFKLIVEMCYSLFCVALPFFIAYIIMRKTGNADPIPFGKPRGGGRIILLLSAGIAVCFIGNVVTSIFYSYAKGMGIDFYSYSEALKSPPPVPDTALTAILSVMHTALIPALMEEFAFRGVIMQPLRKYGDWFAIIITGIMFGLVHGNMMQTPFAIIAGIALGYVAIVTGSVWTSVLLHFMNNFMSLVTTSVSQSLEGMPRLLFTALFMYGLIFVGICAFISYAMYNRNFHRLRPGRYGDYRKKIPVFFLTPTVVLAVILMVKTMLTDIKFIH